MTDTSKPGVLRMGCSYMAVAGSVCNKCGHLHGYSKAQLDAAVAQETEKLRAALRAMLAPWDGFSSASAIVDEARAALGE